MCKGWLIFKKHFQNSKILKFYLKKELFIANNFLPSNMMFFIYYEAITLFRHF